MSGFFSLLTDLARGLKQLVFPNSCWVCQRQLPEEQRSFCATCLTALTVDPFPACPRCGATVGPHVPLDEGCIHCRQESFGFDRVIRLGVHDGLLREVTLRLKQPGSESLAEAIASLWANAVGPRL